MTPMAIPENKQSNRKSFFSKFLLAAFALILLTGLLEIFLRTTHFQGAHLSWSEPDPILGWRYTPGKTYWTNEENDHPILQRELAVQYHKAGQTQKAISLLDSIGDQLIEKGDKEGVREVVTQILAMNPPNAEDYRNLLAQL